MEIFSSIAMLASAIALLALMPTLAFSAGDGNIRLLEEEIAAALKSCPESENPARETQKQKRSTDESPSINDPNKQFNQYSHERRNMTEGHDQIFIVNVTDYDYEGYGSGNEGEKLVKSMPRAADVGSHPNTEYINGKSLNRTKRSEPLLSKEDNDQCLSQCVFANLQVVDSRGIPREAELWTKVQSSVTSQQSRNALRDQIGACFQELQSEAEDNGCSYSNKLERCLMLRFADRKPQSQTETTSTI